MAMNEQARLPAQAPTRGQDTQPAADVESSDSARQQSEELAAAGESAEPQTERHTGRVAPPAGQWVPRTWGEPMTEHRGVTAFSNGGDPGFAPGWSRGQWGYQFQCVEYINRFADRVLGVGNLTRSGHAKDYAAQRFAGLTWVPNDGESVHPPADGDILVFTGGAYGHIGVAASSTPSSVEMIHQNWGDDGRKILGVKQVGGGFRVDDLSKYKTAGWQTAGEKARKPEWTRKDLVHLLLGARGEGGKPAESWATALQRGIVTKDEPDAEPLRGELAVMLDRLFMLPCTGEEYDPAVVAPFADVQQGEWWADASARCRLNGLLKGGGDNRLRPLDPVTKAEARSLLNRLREGPSQLTVAQQTAHLSGASEPLLRNATNRANLPVGAGSTRSVEALGDKQLYAHGGYMGAAPALLRDPIWTGILRTLDPTLAEEMDRPPGPMIGQASGPSSLEGTMTTLENHPVLAAFGACREQGIAWNSGRIPSRGTPLEWDVWLHPEHPEDVDQALVIHGGPFQLKDALEELDHRTVGAESAVYQEVARTDPRGVDQWLSDYHRALTLFAHGGQMPGVAPQVPVPPIYLDIKSASLAEEVDLFVRALGKLGVEVAGVMAFHSSALEGLQTVDGLMLFNGAKDLLNYFTLETAAMPEVRNRALRANRRLPGVKGGLINFGSLVNGEAILDDLVDRVADLREDMPWFSLGGYVQENYLGQPAYAAILRMLKEHPSVFDLGFAYGNVDGRAEKHTGGDGHGPQWFIDT
jgi:hypothetical protein